MKRIIARHIYASEENGQNNFINSIRSVSRIGSFGLMMGASIFMGYFLGSYIDRWLGTYPWFMLLFLVLFMIGAFIKLFQDAGLMSGNRHDKRKPGMDAEVSS